MDEKFWESMKWRQSERHIVLEVVWMGWIEGFGTESVSGLLGLWDSALWLPVWLCQHTTALSLLLPHPMHYSEYLCKVTEGQIQPSLMVSPELLVQASLNSSNNCWHCDLEPLVLEEKLSLESHSGQGWAETMSQETVWSSIWSSRTLAKGQWAP